MREGVNERRLRRVLGSAVDGRPGLVVVEGEAGVGKTWFVQRLLGLPEARGVAPAGGRGPPARPGGRAGAAAPAPGEGGARARAGGERGGRG
ncbi:hypothetical protein P3T37_000923, partial [Kitasatospora sp. MAA4]|nr:hypothetical protein [Kitasatospora sp. MAA4]